MGLFFSGSTKGFYDSNIHAEMPADVVPVSNELHAEMMAGQSAGWVITSDDSGNPILIDRPAQTEAQVALAKIADLEATVTDRRIREAVLGIDNGWLKGLNDQITALRTKIK